MRIAALYDIHGNLPALEAVLADVRAARADCIVAGGDVVVGPMSRDAIACLLECGIETRFVLGNCEVAVLDEIAGRVPAVPPAIRPRIRATADQIEREFVDLIAGWPKTIRLTVDGIGETLFCHGTPRDENEIFTERTAEERLRPLFDPLRVPLVVCGHTHMPFDRQVGATRVVNAGSVGMPFGPPGADWVLLGPRVEPRRTSYDLDAAAARIRASDYPDAEAFAATSVLQPPSAAQMLDLFTPAELRHGA
jgi:predicted phosphodiesterase